MAETSEILGTFVGFIRGLYLLHQNHHWVTSGSNFYSLHLLFERLYQEVAEDVDKIAERTVGKCGVSALNLTTQSKVIAQMINEFAGDNLVEVSLAAEVEFQKICQNVYDEIKEVGELTLGLDDLLMNISSNGESRIYLLKQNL